MVGIEVSVIGDRAVSAGFMSASILTAKAEKLTVRKFTLLLQTRIKANASGRPGPNAPTGDYRRSWGSEFFESPVGFSGSTGTNEPQGQRLENGFVGTDSLGRTFDQPPYPHVGPACDQTEPEFIAAIEGFVKKL